MRHALTVASCITFFAVTGCHETEANALAASDEAAAIDEADVSDGQGVTDSLATDGGDAVDGVDTANATGADGASDVEIGPNGVPLVQLEAPASGFQVRSVGRFIEPGTDVEFCEIVTLPGTPDKTYYVNRIEVAMHPWSHHVIVDAVVPGSETEEGLEDGMSKSCVSAASAYGEDLVDVIGAQSPYSDLQLPENVGRIYHGGQKIIVDYHYFNPTPERIPAAHAINFHEVEEANVQHVAQTFGFYNLGIMTMPGATSKSAASCVFNQDVMISLLTRHTHRWGTDFHIWYEGGDLDDEHIWTSNDWELETNYVYDEPILVRKGEGFRFQCEYDNTTDHLLKFGTKATDEMCILFGIAWSPDSLNLVPMETTMPGGGLTCAAESAPVTDMGD
ncbi:MAG: hypothetical protein VX223_03340 [Myxococcota bacterium]|nr:hypothetical protein [Myxococcota bacterium]